MENTQENEQQVQNEQTNDQAQEQTNDQNATEPAAEQSADANGATAQADEAELLKKKYDELNDKYLRTCAEYDNYRKRTIRERADLLKSAGSDIIEGLLPVIDDFERGLAHMNDAADVAALKEGVDLIYKKFTDYLGKKGVSVIETEGKEFDTNCHEAITMMPAPTPDMKGKILDCVEKGYKMGDKVLRFAKVVVCQ